MHLRSCRGKRQCSRFIFIHIFMGCFAQHCNLWVLIL